MADGKITFKTKIDNSDVEKDLNQTKKKIQKSEEEIAKAENAKLPLTKQSEELGVALDIAKEKMARLKAESESISADMQPGVSPDRYMEAASRKGDVDASMKQQQKEVNALQRKWDAVNNKLDTYDIKIKRANADLAKNKAKAGELSAKLSKGGINMAGAMAAASKAATTFKRRFVEIARQALLFSFIAKGFMAFTKQMSKALNMNAEYRAELARLKGALLTAFQPLYEFILPGLLAVMRVLTAVVSVVANVFSILSGKSLKNSANSAEQMNQEADAIGAVGAAAKEAKKQLAGFDQINKLESSDAGSGGGGGASAPSVTPPNFQDFDTAEYKAKIDELTVYLSGALLALGAILTFGGANIPLGIGLMAAGAIGLAAEIKENWGVMDGKVCGAITNVLTILGGASLVIGAILTFSNADVPLGIGLMVAGAAALGGAVGLNWNSIKKKLQGPIGAITALISTSLIALGAVLAFSNANIPLGIGLMVAGATGLAATVAVNWNSITSSLRGEVGKITAVVCGALLALGAVITFSSANLPLGIGLMVAGAAGLATVTALNWNTVTTSLQGELSVITAIASAALLALGVVLAFSGAALPLGIALIAAGAAGLVTVTTLNWNTIVDKCKEVWESVKSWWNSHVAPVFTIEWWKNKFSCIAEGLKMKVKDGVNAGIALFNRFISWINGKMRLSWGSFSLFGKEIIPSGGFTLLKLPSIPYLAKGAVLPANKPFLSVVGDQRHGTNIEAPLTTIQEAVALVMEDMIGGTMAGFEATVSLLKEILGAIYGISIGDDVIANAVSQYNKKQSVITGEML